MTTTLARIVFLASHAMFVASASRTLKGGRNFPTFSVNSRGMCIRFVTAADKVPEY